MLASAANAFGDLPVMLMGTNDLWYSPEYWEEVDRMKGWEGIIDESRKGRSFCDVYDRFEPFLKRAIPEDLLRSLWDVQAPALYRLFEVAEAAYLMKKLAVQAKVGPESEEQYDVFIKRFMEVVQLSQPTDFRSRPGKPKPLTPYIGNQGEERIFLDDSKEQLMMKVKKLANRSNGQPIRQECLLNPFVRLSVLAVEAAAIADSAPVMLGGAPLPDGESTLKMYERAGTERLMRIAPTVVECLWAYLVKPVQAELRKGGVLQ
jgi:hypothetical protein